MKKHKIAKNALKHPELFAPAELAYFQRWLQQRAERKRREKESHRENSDEVYEL
jgi:hypothetical protein